MCGVARGEWEGTKRTALCVASAAVLPTRHCPAVVWAVMGGGMGDKHLL